MKLDSSSLSPGLDEETPPRDGYPPTKRNTLASTSTIESQNLIWQTEMEKGFEVLIDSIHPYICDLTDVDKLKNLSK